MKWTEDKQFLLCGFTCFVAGFILSSMCLMVVSSMSQDCASTKNDLVKCEAQVETLETKRYKNKKTKRRRK